MTRCAATCPHCAGNCAGKNRMKPGLCGVCGHPRARTYTGTRARVRAGARTHGTHAALPAQGAHANAIRHLRPGMAAHQPAPAAASPHTRARARARSPFRCFEKKREGEDRHG